MSFEADNLRMQVSQIKAISRKNGMQQSGTEGSGQQQGRILRMQTNLFERIDTARVIMMAVAADDDIIRFERILKESIQILLSQAGIKQDTAVFSLYERTVNPVRFLDMPNPRADFHNIHLFHHAVRFTMQMRPRRSVHRTPGADG